MCANSMPLKKFATASGILCSFWFTCAYLDSVRSTDLVMNEIVSIAVRYDQYYRLKLVPQKLR
jgi:hypothetical protein